jgi:hypothetical protein
VNRHFLLLALVSAPSFAHAGMTSFTLTEAAGARIDVISFFLLLFFLCAWLTKWAWNVLAVSFPSLPRLGYKQAVALMLVSSLFLYIVLTMISGARELMTPGAWAKTGATYQLATPERDPKPWLDAARQQAMERLRDALWAYASKHEGQLPALREGDDIDRSLWHGVHPRGEKYGYFPETKPGGGSSVVAFEPAAYGASRYVLTSDGAVTRMSATELALKMERLKAKEGSQP